MKKALCIVLALIMALSLIYTGSPRAYAAGAASDTGKTVAEEAKAASIPERVDVYVNGTIDSITGLSAQVLVDYWNEVFPDHIFRIIEKSDPSIIDTFADAGLENADGSALLISDPIAMLQYYSGTINSDLSDTNMFKAVCAGISPFQPRGYCLLSNVDMGRFSDIASMVEYVKDNPGSARIGYVESAINEVIIKNILDVLGIESEEVQLIQVSNAEILPLIQNGSLDAVIHTLTFANSIIGSFNGNVKGILLTLPSREDYLSDSDYENLASVPILTEIEQFSQADVDQLTFEWPLTVYAHAGVPDAVVNALNAASAGILENEEFVRRIASLGSATTYPVYSVEEINAIQQKVARQINTAYYYDKEAASYPVWFNLFSEDPDTGEAIQTKIQVTDKNKFDILGDGGSIKYDPNSHKLTFNDPDFGTLPYYDYGEENAALIVGDTDVDLVGSAYIPTIYASSADNCLSFNGDFRMGVMYTAVYAAGTVIVQGGTLYAGCNGIPVEAGTFIMYGGNVTTDSPMGTALYVHDMIRIQGGTVAATGGPDHPSIYSGGTTVIGGDTASVNASIFTLEGEDISSYENFEGLECRIVALDGIVLNGLDVIDPEGGKVSEIAYNTYDEYGEIQSDTAYGITKADGTASTNVTLKNARMVTITNCKLELAGKISIRLYFRAPKTAKTAEIFFEDVDTHDFPETPSVTLNLSRTGNPNYSAAQDLFIMAFPKITSREMTRRIRLIVYDEDDMYMPVYYEATGQYYSPFEGRSFEYCAADWANRIIATSTNDKAITMAKALLNYGGAAQKYLSNFNPDYPANPNGYMAEEMSALQPDPDLDMVIPDAAYDLGFERATLQLSADTQIRLYFNKAVTVKVDGKSAKVSHSGSTWLATIDNINSRQLDHMYEIVVTGADGTETIYYSALSWANKQMADSNERSMPTAKAMYLYNRAAKAYIK